MFCATSAGCTFPGKVTMRQNLESNSACPGGWPGDAHAWAIGYQPGHGHHSSGTWVAGKGSGAVLLPVRGPKCKQQLDAGSRPSCMFWYCCGSFPSKFKQLRCSAFFGGTQGDLSSSQHSPFKGLESRKGSKDSLTQPVSRRTS